MEKKKTKKQKKIKIKWKVKFKGHLPPLFGEKVPFSSFLFLYNFSLYNPSVQQSLIFAVEIGPK